MSGSVVRFISVISSCHTGEGRYPGLWWVPTFVGKTGLVVQRPGKTGRVPTLVSRPRTYNIIPMADEPITLEFLARQQQRVLEEIGVMRDDMQVLTAMVMRPDGTVGLVLTELRAMHGQHQRLGSRVRRLEEEREGEPR